MTSLYSYQPPETSLNCERRHLLPFCNLTAEALASYSKIGVMLLRLLADSPLNRSQARTVLIAPMDAQSRAPISLAILAGPDLAVTSNGSKPRRSLNCVRSIMGYYCSLATHAARQALCISR